MKMKIELTKKQFPILLIIVALALTAGFVVGNKGAISFAGPSAPNPGHDPIEIGPGDLTVDGALRLVPRATATCDGSHEGNIYYDSTLDTVYICKNAAWTEYRGPQGPEGPQGPTGATGPQGPEGPQGPAGSFSFRLCMCSIYDYDWGPEGAVCSSQNDRYDRSCRS